MEEPLLPAVPGEMGRTGVVCVGGPRRAAQIPADPCTEDPGGAPEFQGDKVPVVSAAWQKMHKRWLGFWITEKCFLSGGPRPGGSSQQTARSAAIRKSRTRQTAVRNQLMRLDDVAHPTSVRQSTMTQFLQPPAVPPVQPAPQYHQQPP